MNSQSEEPCNFCGTPNSKNPNMKCARTPICTNYILPEENAMQNDQGMCEKSTSLPDGQLMDIKEDTTSLPNHILDKMLCNIEKASGYSPALWPEQFSCICRAVMYVYRFNLSSKDEISRDDLRKIANEYFTSVVAVRNSLKLALKLGYITQRVAG